MLQIYLRHNPILSSSVAEFETTKVLKKREEAQIYMETPKQPQKCHPVMKKILKNIQLLTQHWNGILYANKELEMHFYNNRN